MLVPFVALIAAGLIAGFAAGLFGIGGGFIVVPALLLVLPLFSGDKVQLAHVAIGTSAATIIVVMRELIILANALLKANRNWTPKQA